MSAPKLEPRPEAEVVAWKELTEDQRAAVEGAHRLFSRMAELAVDADKRGTVEAQFDLFLPRIDEKRRNHVVLIDGARGTGKTAAMLRLLVDWAAAVRGKLREDIGTGDDKSPITTDSAIVPVGLLDLQALSPKAMLGLHLAGHLQRVVEAMEQRGLPAMKSASWSPAESTDLPSRKAWQKFLHAAAVAWDGNLKERQGKIDPEAYVLELEHAERERLEIGGTFRKFVDALVDDYHKHFERKPKPFFVITIDDADLNPQRTMEIFELIRVLWHPRVGFLIAGDGDLFVTVLEEEFKRAIETPGAVAITSGGTSPIVPQFAHAGQAEALARDCYRKAIPPMQRFATGLLPDTRFQMLEPLLRQVKPTVMRFDFGSDLAEYFMLNHELQEALPRRIRELVDFREWLQRSIGEKRATPSRCVVRLWRDAFAQAVVARELRAMPWIKYDERTDRLDVMSGGWTSERYVIQPLQLGNHLQGAVYGVSKIIGQPAAQQLPDELLSILKLAVDTVMYEREPSISDALPLRLSGSPVLVELQFLVDGVTYATSAWDVPQLDSSLEYNIIFATWRKYAIAWFDFSSEKPERQFRGIDLLACRFLELVLNHIDRKWIRDGHQIYVEMARRPLSWADLAHRFVKYLANDGFPTPREKAAREWAQQNVNMMAAPEFGLSAIAANAWLEALKDASGENWETVRKGLEGRRKAKTAALGQKIDALAPDYVWTTEVSASNTKQHVDNILRLLAKIPVKHPNGLRWPANLAEYVTDARYENWLKIPPQRLDAIGRIVEGATRNVEGAEEITVFKIWEAAVPVDLAVRQFVQWDKERSGLKVSIPPNSWQLRSNSHSSGSIHLSNIAFEWMSNFGQMVSYADPLLRLAWDVTADRVDANAADKTPIASWRGASFSLHGPTWHWPVPNWLAIIDWDLMVESWNAAFKDARGLGHDYDARQAQRITDAMAFWFIRRVAQLSIFRQYRVEFQFELTPNDWYKLGSNLPHTGGVSPNAQDMVYAKPVESVDRAGARWKAYTSWWDHVVVMAAPESGISDDAAAAFLQGLFAEHDIKNRPHRKKAEAIELRQQYALQCIGRQIDRNFFHPHKAEQYHNHPWHKFFGKESA